MIILMTEKINLGEIFAASIKKSCFLFSGLFTGQDKTGGDKERTGMLSIICVSQVLLVNQIPD